MCSFTNALAWRGGGGGGHGGGGFHGGGAITAIMEEDIMDGAGTAIQPSWWKTLITTIMAMERHILFMTETTSP